MTSAVSALRQEQRVRVASDRGAARRRPRIVIVGGGFGGLTVAERLAKAPVDVTVIDRENRHLFRPLLYQVATAGLSPPDIAWPIRRLVRHQTNTRVLLGEVTGVDKARKRVRRAAGRKRRERHSKGLDRRRRVETCSYRPR